MSRHAYLDHLSNDENAVANESVMTAQTWYGPAMQSRTSEWPHTWSADEIAKIEKAVAEIRDRAHDLMEMSVSDFEPPNVSQRLEQTRLNVLDDQDYQDGVRSP